MATWHAAHFACRDRGSQLAALETQWEDTTIRNYIRKPEFGMILYFYLAYTVFIVTSTTQDKILTILN